MADFWRDQRATRIAERDGPDGFPVAGVDSEGGGIQYVPGQLLMTEQAAQAIADVLDGPEYTDVSDREAWLPRVGLRLFDYDPVGQDPEPVPVRAAKLDALAKGRADPTVCDVAPHYVLAGEPAGYIFRGGPATAPWPAADLPVLTWGSGPPVVAVLDTGVVVESPGGILNQVVTDPNRDVDAMHPPGQQAGDLAGEAGHGTFICYVIQRMAGQGVSIASTRVLDPDGLGTESDIVLALERLRATFTENPGVPPIAVVNLSFGGYTDDATYTEKDANGNDVDVVYEKDRVPLGLRAAIAAWQEGTVFVAAAGNNGLEDRPFWPAAMPEVVAVASLDPELRRSSFSNSGDWVDASTLGEGILGATGFGDFPVTATYKERLEGVVRWTGTSFAAPIVAAEIVRRLGLLAPGTTGLEAWDHLLTERLAEQQLAGDEPPRGTGQIMWDPRVMGVAIDPRYPDANP